MVSFDVSQREQIMVFPSLKKKKEEEKKEFWVMKVWEI